MQRRGPPDLADMIQKMVPQMERAVPSHLSADKMARICLTALRVTPKLQQCSPQSFLGAMMSAATLGLEVNTPLGHAYLVPYKTECTLIIGYRGMMELARRSGVVRSIRAVVVREGDTFEVVEGLHPSLEHRPSTDPGRSDKAITHVYAVAALADGDPVFIWMSKAEVDKRRKRSRASGSGPWVTDFEAMAKKTAIRALFPWLPQSTEVASLAAAVALDEAGERGAPQVRVYSPEVVEALAEAGVEIDPGADEEPAQSSEPEETRSFLEELEELDDGKEVAGPRG